MEQVLNAWLADQKPASPDLLSLSRDAMQGFSRWTDDIAAGTDAHWKSGVFRASAEALRHERRLVPLALPEAAPAPVPAAEAPAAEAPSFDLPDFDAPAPDAPPEAVSEAVAEAAPEAAGDLDDFFKADAATVLLAPSSRFAGASAPAAEPAASPAPDFDFALDLPDAAPAAPEVIEIEGIDFASLSAVSGAVPDAPQAPDAAAPVAPALDLPDFPEAADEPVAVPAAADAPEFDLGDFDLAEPAPAADAALEAEPEAAAPAQPLEAVDEAPADDMDFTDAASASDDQVKVIGPLRIGIPLYNVYLNEADEWSRRLVTEVTEWALELNTPVADSTVGLAHSLAGSSATVGFAALSEMARALEHALQHAQLQSQGTPDQASAFTGAAEDIRRLLHQFAAGFLKEPDARILQALKDLEAREPLPEAPAAEAFASASGFGDLDFSAAPASVTIIHPPEPEPVAEAAPEPEPEPEPEPVAQPEPAFDQTIAQPVARSFIAPAATTVAAPEPEREAVRDADDEIDAFDAIDPDLFPIFEEEALELLPQLGGALRQWSARPDNRSARDEVLRALHTLKGSARLAGALRLGEMAHRMESEIEYFDSESLDSSQFDPLLVRFDAMQATFDALRMVDLQAASEPEPVPAPIEETPAQRVTPAVASPASATATPAEVAARRALIAMPATNVLAPVRQAANQAVRVRSQLLDRLVNQAGEVMITRSRLEAELGQLRGSLGDLSGNLDRLRSQLRDIELQAESQMQTRLAQAKDTAQGFDPLEFDRFTRVQELTRMMAESVNDVATVQRNLQRTVEATEDDLIAQARQTRELQRDLLRTRMVEFEGISERLYRVVRQASKDTAKQVKLDITGGSIEMDRGVLDRMTPAFEHLLRNCVAHGIEEPEVRKAAGKDASGTILINLRQEGNDVSVEFSDDGAGLNLSRIREKALSQGLIEPGHDVTDADAANLIFMPGFSTATHVTELSGRGIGMDVVRSEINALGGRIETTTQQGQGTNFKLVLPLTTAVTQVVMLRTDKLSFGVPANLVELVRRATPKELQQAYNSGTYDFGGEQIPFFWSGALLQVSQRSAEAQSRTIPVVIFRSAAQRVAMHIDEVLGNQEVVVKNLGPQLARLPGLAGMTVLASGAVALIYNPVALAAVYGDQARALSADHAQPEVLEQSGTAARAVMPVVEAVPQIPLVLVVDDSITVRRVTQRLLQREGYRVALAADGLQALERLQEELPTVVLSDIEMPRMDGFDLARNIRGDARLAALPIIMITSRIAEKHREHAMELGVNNYLGKPYSEEELLSLVRHYCAVETAE